MRIDRRTLRRAKEARPTWHENEKERLSFMKAVKERGIQPLCRKCTLKCKVLNGENGSFECFDFVGNNGV